MGDAESILWKPLLEETAQVIVGALGSYGLAKIVSKLYSKNTFDGSIDLWKRGILNETIHEGDIVHINGLISPYSQLFPGNPYENAKRYNKLYEFDGKITNSELQTLEFACGSDSALRLKNFNGESVVGIYHRYGFIGEGILGIVPTDLLKRKIPNFFEGRFCATRAIISGRLTRCPSTHGFVVQGIALKAGIPMREIDYSKLYYIQVNSIKIISKESENTFSLLGTTWAVTESKSNQYIVSYGYLSDDNEKIHCVNRIQHSKGWNKAKVYFDDIESPSHELSFTRNFIL